MFDASGQILPVKALQALLAIAIAHQEELHERRQLRRPYFHNALESGEHRFRRFLQSENPTRITNRLRMSKRSFCNLAQLLQERTTLQPTFHCSVEQQLGMWLQAWAHATSVRQISEEFQHSLETISRHVNAVCRALSSLSTDFVRLPSPANVPKEIRNSSKFYPYFKDCIGAIDGSYIQGTPDPLNAAAYRGRKSGTGINVLFACTFDLRFCFVLAGWEASAHDSTVLNNAIADKGFDIPKGKYYLADAGYPSSDHTLVPYRGVRYHLNEQGLARTRPENAKELYNLRHAMLRNVVERIIGVLKNRFRLLKVHNEYPIEKQVQGIYAATVIHNYLQGYNEADIVLDDYTVPAQSANHLNQIIPDALDTRGALLRDTIAKAMWDDYVNTRPRRSRPTEQA